MGDRIDTSCPCCGQSIGVVRPIIDLQTNTISYGDEKLEIMPRCCVVFAYLILTKWPKTVPFDDLRFGMWGNQEPKGWRYGIPSYAHFARPYLRHFGIAIRAVHGVGYRAELPTHMIEGKS